jgi:hypothetical protein
MVLASSIVILLGGIMSKMGNGLNMVQQNILAAAIIGTVCLCTLIVITYAARQFKFNVRLWQEQKEISKQIAAGTLRRGSRPGSIKLTSQKSSNVNNESRPTAQQFQDQFRIKNNPTLE